MPLFLAEQFIKLNVEELDSWQSRKEASKWKRDSALSPQGFWLCFFFCCYNERVTNVIIEGKGLFWHKFQDILCHFSEVKAAGLETADHIGFPVNKQSNKSLCTAYFLLLLSLGLKARQCCLHLDCAFSPNQDHHPEVHLPCDSRFCQVSS